MTQGKTEADQSRLLSLTSLFDDRDTAVRAVERLKAAGIAQAQIGLIADLGASLDQPRMQDDHRGRLEDFLFPSADQAMYREGIRRGGHVLTVSGLTADQHDLVRDILDVAGTVDLDERMKTWRAEGWSNTQDFLDALQEPPTVIDGDVAASLIEKGHGDDVTTIVTERLKSTEGSSKSQSRVRVYTVEYALKSPGDGAESPQK